MIAIRFLLFPLILVAYLIVSLLFFLGATVLWVISGDASFRIVFPDWR